MNKFVNNQYILYILCFLAITNMLGFLYVKDYDSIVLLIALVIVTSYFTENHIIQLSVGLIGTNFIFVNRKVSEGFLNQKQKQIERFKNRRKEEFTNDSDSDSESGSDSDSDENFTNRRKRKQGFKVGKKRKSLKARKKGKSLKARKKGRAGLKNRGEKERFSNNNKLDQSSTLNEAYNNISDVLGNGGINNLTKETQQLISQQKNLVKQMASLGPMIANVSNLAKNMPDIKNLGGLMKGSNNK